jgi:hypothetical protein
MEYKVINIEPNLTADEREKKKQEVLKKLYYLFSDKRSDRQESKNAI